MSLERGLDCIAVELPSVMSHRRNGLWPIRAYSTGSVPLVAVRP